ncbi:MAG: aminodeoxychorismate/anthranilate synthase component II [Saprospiraceae bacterium]|nr:aminodeoxychorismate/anthranilate synthase component II [Saprospiraceae bacterium]
MIVIIDNYDSFTFNLVHLVQEVTDSRVYVMKNDQIEGQILSESSHIILSPGPGIPDEAGCLTEVIRKYAHNKAMLGVCLGHQAIAEVFGARLYNLPRVFHGMRSLMIRTSNKSKIFNELPDRFFAGRYHSWAIEKASDVSCFQVVVEDEDGQIMAIEHTHLPLYGVQFHPESIMTEYGKIMIQNFLQIQAQ